MSLYIVDASVAAKWFIDEEYGDAAVSILNERNTLHAPDFLLLEMDSIICKWIRRGSVDVEESIEVRDAIRRYPIQLHPFVTFLDLAFAVAEQTKQTVYDCLYVALAALLKGKMVTADRKLYDAVKKNQFKKNVVWIGDI